jgi:dTDP-4-amino-4,6-dideoxygalactose transaminase
MTTQIQLPSDQDATGRTLAEEEIQYVAEAIRSGTLTSTKGKFTKQLEEEFATMTGTEYAYACTSGTAAIHCAVAAINPEPGDEIITTPITDMGALTPIVYQGAVPVFADVDPDTCNVTAETIEAVISERTRAIIVTHLFGNPCEMEAIMELASAKNIPVIEDCAQAYLAEYQGKVVGSIGDIGCFSLQQGKHITTGEGGLVTTNNPKYARHMYLFINKAWGYGDKNPDHYFLAPNYRMSELQGAVALAQLQKLREVVNNRVKTATQLNEKLAGIPGVALPKIPANATHTYWKHTLHIDADIIEGGATALGKALQEMGVFCAPRYIQKPAFKCEVFRDQNTFGDSHFPFNLARTEAVDYKDENFTGSFDGLEKIIVLPWNEKYTQEHVDYLADCIRSASESLIRRSSAA